VSASASAARDLDVVAFRSALVELQPDLEALRADPTAISVGNAQIDRALARFLS